MDLSSQALEGCCLHSTAPFSSQGHTLAPGRDAYLGFQGEAAERVLLMVAEQG